MSPTHVLAEQALLTGKDQENYQVGKFKNDML